MTTTRPVHTCGDGGSMGYRDPGCVACYKPFASDREELMAALDRLGALEQRLAEALGWIVGVAPHLHELYHHASLRSNGPGTHEACQHPDCEAARQARAFLADQEAQP